MYKLCFKNLKTAKIRKNFKKLLKLDKIYLQGTYFGQNDRRNIPLKLDYFWHNIGLISTKYFVRNRRFCCSVVYLCFIYIGWVNHTMQLLFLINCLPIYGPPWLPLLSFTWQDAPSHLFEISVEWYHSFASADESSYVQFSNINFSENFGL